jgi:hypothetical protein
VNRDGTI